MVRKSSAVKTPEYSRSQIMAMAEVLAESGVRKAAIVYLTEDGSVGLNTSDELSVMELIFCLRQAEHFVLSNDSEEPEEDFED